jgi:hypothetical protein
MKKIFMAAAVLSLLAVSCTEFSLTPKPAAGDGQLRIYLIDAPAAYDAVNIAVARVEVHRETPDSTSGWFVINDEPEMYDLLELRNGVSAVLGEAMLGPGTYTQIRLILETGSHVKIGDQIHDLYVPSGFQTGIKLNHEFTIQSGKLYELYLDFDAERSVRYQGNRYRMSPVIRVNAVVTSGSVSGTVDPASAKAYVFTTIGQDTVSARADTLTGFFRLMAIPEGTYDIHFTSLSGTHNDTTVTGVGVVKQVDTKLGTIPLSEK